MMVVHRYEKNLALESLEEKVVISSKHSRVTASKIKMTIIIFFRRLHLKVWMELLRRFTKDDINLKKVIKA